MEINRRDLFSAGMAMGVGLAAKGSMAQAGGEEGNSRGEPGSNSGIQPSSVDMNYKPRRINKVIELWEDGQPAYYAQIIGNPAPPGMSAYDFGKKWAKTYADCIKYGLEHGPVDFLFFSEFMRGLKDGGPTRSGHATPTVFVEPPCTGLNEDHAIANAWIVNNFLDLGAHSVHISHARDPMAIEVYCQMASRFSFDYPDTPRVARQGMGLRGQPPGVAPSIWGISPNQYMHVADVWPLNPKGEIMIGCKIEDHFAIDNMKMTLATPGLAFSEWGPTDNAQSLFGLAAYPLDSPGGRARQTPEQVAIMADVRARVLAECKKNNVRFLNSSSPDPNSASYVLTQIKDGAMFMGGAEKAAQIGREYTKRKMPV